MKKKIISVLLSASMISIVCPVNAGNSGLVENITFENFEENITVSTVQTDFGTLRVNTSGKSIPMK